MDDDKSNANTGRLNVVLVLLGILTGAMGYLIVQQIAQGNAVARIEENMIPDGPARMALLEREINAGGRYTAEQAAINWQSQNKVDELQGKIVAIHRDQIAALTSRVARLEGRYITQE